MTDGRNIDRALGTLSGEAGGILSRHPEKAASLGASTLSRIATPPEASTTYYEQPILKAPVWKAYIPAYLFVGGVAGGCMVFGAAAQLVGGKRLRPLVTPARWIASGAIVTSAVLLIADLGRPMRFLNMLRVFRPTSPMNVGTWILTGAGAAATASAALPILGAPRLGNVAGLVSAPFGLGLASYTSVLLANTAVPTWQYGNITLPPLFVASAAASAASALDVVPQMKKQRYAARAVDAFGTAAKIAELLAGVAYERALARKGSSVVTHVRQGRSGALFRTSQALTLGSLAASWLGARRLAGVLGLSGAAALRFAVTEAGRSSAVDPRATFEPQREAPLTLPKLSDGL